MINSLLILDDLLNSLKKINSNDPRKSLVFPIIKILDQLKAMIILEQKEVAYYQKQFCADSIKEFDFSLSEIVRNCENVPLKQKVSS